MKKRNWLAFLAVLVLAAGSVMAARAEIIPAEGVGQYGMGAVVLCENLTLREEPNTSSKAVKTLHYRDIISVTDQENEWARVITGEGEDAPVGWVNADYLVIDPAWYRTEKATPVYAWNDTAAPKVALLDANTVILDPETYLPILKQDGDWLIVSLRGAVGWIYTGN